MSEHDQVPTDATDGDTFTCSCCGVGYEFVDLADGQPGEWVQTHEGPPTRA